MNEYVETAEEKVYAALLHEKRDEITEAARELVGRAEDCSYRYNCVSTYAFQLAEFYVAEYDMLSQACLLSEHDRKVLTEVAQAARAASESLDRDDFETLVGYRVWVGNLHYYYAMISQMVEQALEPIDASEIDPA